MRCTNSSALKLAHEMARLPQPNAMTEPDRPVADNTCRLLLHGAAAGGWNMAADELLLQQASATGQTSLRIYGWSEPTLSLGYFQSYAERLTHPPSRDCQLVRRRSGGGAILHQHEITYAMAMPIQSRWGSAAEALVETVHRAVVGLLEQIGCRATLYEGVVSGTEFLCFHRRARSDVIAGAVKLMGSAQRRSKAALLQHGSLLLTRSLHAPTLPGVFDVIQASCSLGQLQLALADQILAGLELERRPAELSSAEQSRVDAINRERFSTENWTRRR
jgi:lipoate-protein ligase A